MDPKRLGEDHGYRMLEAFAGDRDYEEALRQARLINQLYPGSRFHHYAKGLAEQLPKRKDDFTKLKLPTPAEWTALKKKLTRTQQIDFLCERMRLLNCGPDVGFYPLEETQFAEPIGLSGSASQTLHRGKTKVINPLTKLIGPFYSSGEDKARPKGMALTLKDVPLLSKYLRDDWFMLVVTDSRNFTPYRKLSSTRPQFAEIINDLAARDVCKVRSWDNLTPAAIGKEIDRINRWALANADKTRTQLEWDALNEALKAGARWHEVEKLVDSLLKKKQDKAYDVLKHYLENANARDSARLAILKIYLRHDPARAKNLAPKYLDHEDKFTFFDKDILRFAAALIVFQTGDKARARPILGDALVRDCIDPWRADALVEAVDLLLKDGTAESRKQVRRLFSNPYLRHKTGIYRNRPRLLRYFAAAGMSEPYRFYVPLLDINKSELRQFDEDGKPSGASYFYPTVAEESAREIVRKFAPDDAEVKKIVKQFPKTADQIPHLKKWLRSRIEKSKD